MEYKLGDERQGLDSLSPNAISAITAITAMNSKDRDLLNDNRERLAQLIHLNHNLINQVINKAIFSQRMMDDIQQIEDPMEKKRRFLFDLTRRGPDACDQLVEVLYGIGQVEAAKLIRPESFRGQSPEQVIENITSPLSPPIDPTAIPMSPLAAIASQESAGGHTISEVQSEEFMNTVQVSKKAMVGENIYRMLADPRGFCLLFNIHDFTTDAYEKREGSTVEANRLRDVFTELHFTVKLFENSDSATMKDMLRKYSKDPQLKMHEAIIVIVLTHGERDHVITSEGRAIHFEDIVQYFNNENCPQLIDKPKLFFFNCCRGDDRDSGPKHKVEEDEEVVSDAKTISTCKIPTANDIMICYSTVNGYVSWRNPKSGSWFGTALSQALMKHSHDKELHHLLTLASSTINNRITSNGFKQVMEHSYRGFRKLFYFNPGIPPRPSNAHSEAAATPSHSNESAQ